MEKAHQGFLVIFSAILTVSLTLAAEADDIQLVADPKGPYIRAIVGEPFNISCEGIGDQSLFSSMKWQDPTGSVFTEGNITGVMKKGNKLFLSILNPTFHDSGIYNCSAQYNYEDNLQYGVYLEFYSVKPEFDYNLLNFTVRENSSLEINCSARGQPPITHGWFSSGGYFIPENESNSVFSSNSENWSTLKIPKVRMVDKGRYDCTAINSFGMSSLTCIINVFNDPDVVVPRFILPFENVTSKEGYRLILRCEAQGARPMEYTWYNQKEDVISKNASMPIYVSNVEDFSLLTFENLRNEDEGTYTCTASNMYGLESKMYSLQVTTSNESDINGTSQFRNAKVVNVSTNSVDFHIATIGSVNYIEVKYSENRDTTTRSRRFMPVPGNVYRITDLVSSGLYNFQFRTTPSEGEEWSKIYQVITMPDPPEIIFQSMHTNSVTLEWFRKTDEILRGTIDFHEIKYFWVQMQGGNTWKPTDCAVTIQVPICKGNKYTISGLTPKMYYQIEVRAHTAAGYGEASRQKVYLTQ